MAESGLQSQACTLCKRRKKWCSKTYPRCAYCERQGWTCEYPTPRRPGLEERLRPGESGRTMTSPLNQLSERSSQSLSNISLTATEWNNDDPFPPAFFLDFDLFQQCRLTTPRDFATVPAYIQPFVGDLDSVRNVATKHFNKIQIWMPIVAKKPLFRYLLNPLSKIRADITLLIVAMRLINLFPVDKGSDPKAPMYVAAKRYYTEAEAMGVLSLPCLQAGVLISIYEFGHGIYPAAFFTIASCARYAALLGLDAKQALFQDKPSDWVEVEERRRVWWAILIIDRCMNTGCPSRSLATSEPPLDSILPVDDALWNDAGDMPEKYLSLSFSASLEMGQFARFAQAAHLLGRVYRHVSDSTVDESFRAEEREQLRRTLLALANVSMAEENARNLSFCSQISTCYSALLILRQPYAFGNETTPTISEDGFQLISNPIAITHNAFKVVQTFTNSSAESISPFILNLLYKSAVFSTEIGQQQEIFRSQETVETIKEVLSNMNTKWRAAGAYLDMLRARETWYD